VPREGNPMKLGREITGLARSVKYDLRNSQRARMYLIVAVFSFAAIVAATVAATQMPGLAEATSNSAAVDGEELGPAGLTEQHGATSSTRDGGGALTDGVGTSSTSRKSPESPEPTSESSSWERPTKSPTPGPKPDPSPTTPSPDPSDSDSPTDSPSPTESSFTPPTEDPTDKD